LVEAAAHAPPSLLSLVPLQATFAKRKGALLKKAFELSVLCDCEVALIVRSQNDTLTEYASSDMDAVLRRYAALAALPHEKVDNATVRSCRGRVIWAKGCSKGVSLQP